MWRIIIFSVTATILGACQKEHRNFFIETYEIPDTISKVEVLQKNNKLLILTINKQGISSIMINDDVEKGILFRVYYDDGDVVESEFHIIKPGMTMVLEFNSNRKLYCKLKNADLL